MLKQTTPHPEPLDDVVPCPCSEHESHGFSTEIWIHAHSRLGACRATFAALAAATKQRPRAANASVPAMRHFTIYDTDITTATPAGGIGTSIAPMSALAQVQEKVCLVRVSGIVVK